MRSFLMKLAVPLYLLLAGPAAAQSADICQALSFPKPGQIPAIKASGESVRVLAFGDFGGGPGQKDVATAMTKAHQAQPFDFGITLGDNFYPNGLNSPTSERWATDWENHYKGLGIRFYASLGNHDHYDPASPIAEALYSQVSKSWCSPGAYYTYTAGPVQFFVLDTDSMVRGLKASNYAPFNQQKKWLEEQLKASKAVWKVVYGHHPIYSTGQHQSECTLVGKLLPLLKDRVDVYIAGHEHDMQYLKPEGGVHFFVSGAGGAETRKLGPDPEGRRIWGVGKTYGFTVLEAEAKALTVSFVDKANKLLCKVKLTKGNPAVVNCPKSLAGTGPEESEDEAESEDPDSLGSR